MGSTDVRSSSVAVCGSTEVRRASIAQLRELGLFIEPTFLSVEECKSIRFEMMRGHQEPGLVTKDGKGVVDELVRQTHVAIVAGTTERAIAQRLRSMSALLQRHFGIRLRGVSRPQFLVYRRGAFFTAHTDNSLQRGLPPTVGRRRLSAVIFLNRSCIETSTRERDRSASSFGDGRLTFYDLPECPTPATHRLALVPRCGLLVVFPSQIWHEVLPVTWGARFSIVSWFV
jgi:predicted 2-oxoglutarate/Fe(II)-dependent dioxygenase YbiX